MRRTTPTPSDESSIGAAAALTSLKEDAADDAAAAAAHRAAIVRLAIEEDGLDDDAATARADLLGADATLETAAPRVAALRARPQLKGTAPLDSRGRREPTPGSYAVSWWKHGTR